MQLPEHFCSRMRKMLGEEEYQTFIESYQLPRQLGLRVNTEKITCREFEQLSPFPLKKIPWVENGYFYREEDHPARCAYYQAGLYYLQEPSAMTPASRIPIQPGDYVLDLCAAPGGKATALGAQLKGRGLLVANDISTSRCRALLRNLELFGISNAFVTNEAPAKLTGYFPEFFHKIVLDAPCSGEGMFRKEEAMATDWTPEKSEELVKLQRSLIIQAVKMLRPGGMLLYSTCTFAPAENEGTISYLLEQYPEMELLDLAPYEGFAPGVPQWGNGDERLQKCVRIFPHRMNGEGHFLALLQKPGLSAPAAPVSGGKLDKNARKLLEEFFLEIGLGSLGGQPLDYSRMEVRSDKVYLLPPVHQDFRGINFLRNGLYLGDLKKNRFEPSQPLACAIQKSECKAVLTLPVDDERLPRYFRGETLSVKEEEATVKKGWLLVTVNGYSLGWGKLVNGTLKNKYPAGWRLP